MSDEIFLRDSNVFIEAKHVEAVTQMFEGALHRTEADEDGNIIYIDFDVNVMCVDEALFMALVPFMRDGSFFELCDDMGNIWRWVYDNGSCESAGAIILWPKPGEPPGLSGQIQKAFTQHLMAEGG
jgi:hypothetical protein